MKERCEATLRRGGWNSYACTHPAKMRHEGKGYCGVHDPVKRETRRKELTTKWRNASTARLKGAEEEQHKLDTWDGLLAACELAIRGEECVCKDGGCLYCRLTAAVKAATP